MVVAGFVPQPEVLIQYLLKYFEAPTQFFITDEAVGIAGAADARDRILLPSLKDIGAREALTLLKLETSKADSHSNPLYPSVLPWNQVASAAAGQQSTQRCCAHPSLTSAELINTYFCSLNLKIGC